MQPAAKPGRLALVGIALISMALLTLEITLTRVFSVKMWYHFAFMSISLALLGGAVGGIVVYVWSSRLGRPTFEHKMAHVAAVFAASVIVCVILYLTIPFWGGAGTWHVLTVSGMTTLITVYIDLAVPFFFGGMCLAMALRAWGDQVSIVYFADLVGASLGCILSILALQFLGGVNALFVVGLIGSVAAWAFGHSTRQRAWTWASAILTFGVVLLVAVNLHGNFFRVVSTKTSAEGVPEARPDYERWNSFSRITVYPTEFGAFGWGMSDRYTGPMSEYRLMLIDTAAGTPIQSYNGDPAMLEFLKYDISSFVHYVRPQGSTLIIGSGGGRDVLAGIAFGKTDLIGVEVNPIIVDVVRGKYGQFSGHVYDLPGVQVVVDEARNYISRSNRRYDVIQASLIDTWAATSAGAFALAENSLYTREAFVNYYRHLSDDGILTMTRWYFPDSPGEILRLVSLALDAWQAAGAPDPRQNVMVIARMPSSGRTEGTATLLAKRTPFTTDEIGRARQEAARLNFEVLYAPGAPGSNPVAALVTAPDWSAVWRSYPVDITPPTDDRPYFFNLLRATDYLAPKLVQASADYMRSRQAMNILLALLGVTTMLSALFVVGPLYLTQRRALAMPGLTSALGYFACLGLGFMLVEISTVQRFVLFLGRPVYALAVVLFSLLLFSGIGSYLTRHFDMERSPHVMERVLLALAGVILLQALLVPLILNELSALALLARVIVSVILLSPLGMLGMPFPLGIRQVSRRNPDLIPWTWGVNGSVSVLGSVVALMISIHFGFRAAMLLGLVIYLGAMLFARHGMPLTIANS